MSNARRIKKRYAPVLMDFTGYTDLHLDKAITEITTLRANGGRLTKAGQLRLKALRAEQAARG